MTQWRLLACVLATSLLLFFAVQPTAAGAWAQAPRTRQLLEPTSCHRTKKHSCSKRRATPRKPRSGTTTTSSPTLNPAAARWTFPAASCDVLQQGDVAELLDLPTDEVPPSDGGRTSYNASATYECDWAVNLLGIGYQIIPSTYPTAGPAEGAAFTQLPVSIDGLSAIEESVGPSLTDIFLTTAGNTLFVQVFNNASSAPTDAIAIRAAKLLVHRLIAN